ncbi:MAG: class I SAM-dependent methyltransferase [Solirubrobacteraceae bacterium]
MHAVQLSDEQVEGQMNYILVRERSLDEMLLPYGDPAGKDVLVFGGGLGNEVLWSIRRGARSILSVDLTPPTPEPLKRLLAAEGLQHPSWEMRRENIHDTALRGDTYDLIVSNGVFEHVMDLKGVLAAFRRLLRPNGRVAIVADGLWYSSIGGHIQGEPWEHLWNSPEDIKEQHPDRWKAYCDYLNRMTIVDFLEAIRSVGMIVLQLSVRRDQYLHRLPQYLPKIRERLGTVSPTDCSIVSIGCELCFEEQL